MTGPATQSDRANRSNSGDAHPRGRSGGGGGQLWGGWGIAFGVFVGWVVLVLAAVAMERLTGRPVPTCLFKRMTGYPCATCGSTRAALSVLRADFAEAFLYNPLMVTLAAAAPLWIATRWLRERRHQREGRPRVCWSSSQRAVAWIIGLTLLSANWAYVVWRGN